MRPRINQLTSILFLLVLIISTVGCTTTTKKLTTTKPRADSTSQLAKAREAFDQKNYQQAAALLKPLAEQGDADAQYALGYLYHNGLGVPRNYKLAIQWITAASVKGNKKATEALQRISAVKSTEPDYSIREDSNSQESELESPKPIVISGQKPQAMKATEPSSPAPEVSTGAAVQPESEVNTKPEAGPEPASTPEPTTPAPAKEMALNESENWIMEQEDTNFTIQIMATSSKNHMVRFIEENNLKASTKYYKTVRNGKDWFTLIQGSFESPSIARTAIENLPPNLQQLKPWVKPFSDIKDALKNR